MYLEYKPKSARHDTFRTEHQFFARKRNLLENKILREKGNSINTIAKRKGKALNCFTKSVSYIFYLSLGKFSNFTQINTKKVALFEFQ